MLGKQSKLLNCSHMLYKSSILQIWTGYQSDELNWKYFNRANFSNLKPFCLRNDFSSLIITALDSNSCWPTLKSTSNDIKTGCLH